MIKSFQGQISVSKIPPHHPNFTSEYASSPQFISCVFQLAVMILQHKVAQLSPFPPSLGQKFYNILFQTCTSELRLCRSEWVKFTPLASREYAGRKVHTEQCQAEETSQCLLAQSNTNTSLQGWNPHNHLLLSHNTKHQHPQHLQGRVLLIKELD